MRLDKSTQPSLPCSYCSARPTHDFSLEVHISFNSISFQTLALVDSGASACFMDAAFAYSQKIPLVRLLKPIPVEAIDGRLLSSGAVIEETTPLVLQIGEHRESLTFYLITSPRHPIILGLSWLRMHNPIVDWCKLSITFNQQTHSTFHAIETPKPGIPEGTDSNSVIHASTAVEIDPYLIAHSSVVLRTDPTSVSQNPVPHAQAFGDLVSDSLPKKYGEF